MPEQSRDRLEAHAAQIRLGGQSVSELMGVDVAEICCGSGFLDGFVDTRRRDWTAAVRDQEDDNETEVFTRFSTVLGSRGSADTVRDTRGFAVKFYTNEGTFDLVGNNMPVFFIQDGIKFPDIIHATKPQPDREIP